MDKMLHHEVHRCEGSDEWVVLIHGIGGDIGTWIAQTRVFRRHFSVLLLDMPGHGKSFVADDRVPPAYTDEMFVEATAEVMDSLGIEKAHFVSISLGSSIVYALVHLAPERMTSAVFGGGVCYVKGLWRLIFNTTIFLGRNAPWLFSRKLLYKFICRAVMPRKAQAKSRKRYFEAAQQLSIKNFWAWIENTNCHLQDETLQLFAQDFNRERIPSFWMSGSMDYVCRPGVERYVKELEFGEYFLSENVGHVVNIDGWTVFNSEVIAWLQNLTSEGSQSDSAGDLPRSEVDLSGSEEEAADLEVDPSEPAS